MMIFIFFPCNGNVWPVLHMLVGEKEVHGPLEVTDVKIWVDCGQALHTKESQGQGYEAVTRQQSRSRMRNRILVDILL